MARTAYHYVKTLDFASNVALGMDSLSPKFVSSPLPKNSSRLVLLRAAVAGEVLDQSLDNCGQEAPIDNQEVTREHFPKLTPSSSNAKDEFCNRPRLDIMYNPVCQTSEPCLPSPGNDNNVKPMYTIINFGITSPSRVVSSKSIKDFNNNYDPNCYEHWAVETVSNSAPVHRVEYENEFPGQHDLLSNFIKSEPIEVPDYALLEKGVACFLKKCREEVVPPLCPLPNYSPDDMTGICKNERGVTSSNDDTGIGSLDDDDLTISDDSLDGKGIQYVSELKGTILRIRKLSKEADKFKKTPKYADLQQRMINLEANVKCLKLQANDLKKKVKLRNKKVSNPYYWSRSSSFNKAV